MVNFNRQQENRRSFAAFFLIVFCICNACQSQEHQVYGAGFAYDLQQPVEKYVLPKGLREVSGLTWLGSSQVGLVQDERADWYKYDLKQREVLEQLDFGKNGDFEGIELVGKHMWAVRSDGRLYRFRADGDDPDAKDFKTQLDEDNDVEGLGYWPAKKLLLLACKGDGEHKDSGNVDGKAIYTFDPKEEELSEKPLFVISDPAMATFLGEDADRAVTFNPSAIAWHPKEKSFYVLSSAGKKLVVVDKNFKISHLIYLNDQDFKQPEGICFAPDGTMYISSEGRDGNGYVVQFKYSPAK